MGDVVDLAVTHGGEGTAQINCVQGQPFTGISLQFEQCPNVQYCAVSGSARLMSQREIRGTDWAELVRQVLAGDDMRSHARWIVGLVEGLGGPGRVAETIYELL